MGTPRKPWWLHPLTISTALTLGAGGTATWLEYQQLAPLLMYALYGIAYAAGGWYSTWRGVSGLLRGRVDVDLLMILAAAGAAILGFWHEGVVLLFLFTLSNALQAFAMDRTRHAVTALMELHPDEALVQRGGHVSWIPVESIRIGDEVVVRPGDRVPIDGSVVAGSSWVDESSVTGESVPVAKQRGSDVFAGTVNQNGVLEVRATSTAGDTVLARIVRLVEEARTRKAATQERIERFERHYARVVIVVAVGAATLPLRGGMPVVDTVYRALTLMVVASPCAVAIAAPSAFLSSISAAARQGVLLKGGRYLERLASVDIIAFDKTGTLTQGQLRVAAVIPVAGESVASVLAHAAAVEAHAEHPLARAVVAEASRRGISAPQAREVEAIPGAGIRGTIAGRKWQAGRPSLFQAGPESARLEELSGRLRRHGQTVVWVGADEPIGLISFRDVIRPGVTEVVRQLRALGTRRIVMLTGDSREVAEAVGRQVGVDEIFAELLPHQKVEQIESLTEQGVVAMVGDGINDAPALSRAHVGVGMGAIGSDVALESADLVLVDDDLDRLPFALLLGRQTRRVVLQGLSVAFAVIGVLMLGVLTGQVGLPLAVLGHEGSTLLVVANGLRLLTAGRLGKTVRRMGEDQRRREQMGAGKRQPDVA